jgi:hypothetical protein
MYTLVLYTTNTVSNKGVSFFLLLASATGCTEQGLKHRTNFIKKENSELSMDYHYLQNR